MQNTKVKTIFSVNSATFPNSDVEQKSLNYTNIRDHSNSTSSKRWVGGVRKWQFLMIYSTVNHQRVGWVLKKSKT